MQKDKIIESTKKFTNKLLSGEGSGHDYWHVERVLNNARQINKIEHGDNFIIDMAILLHDVGDRKVIKKEDDDYSIAENFLKKQKISTRELKEIMYIIQNMSFSKSLNNKNTTASKEFCIVQDADRLDAIGAIGISRLFTYGGSRSRVIYDPSAKPAKFTNTKAYKKISSASFHHFEEKLLLLKNLMNTKTAKKIATKRDKYMRGYMKQFLAEWNGKA